MFKKLWVRIVSVIVCVLIALSAAFLIYANIYYKADSRAKAALQSDNNVIVEEKSDYWVFEPKQGTGNLTEAGYIFYPGGKVQETSYAPLMHAVAEEGITCILLKMPFRLAVFDINAADSVMGSFPKVKEWYVGGHSLGGAMAAVYAGGHSSKLKGLILMAAYSTSDLSGTQLRMLSFYGSKDGVLNKDSFEKYKKNQPKDTTYYEIQGGNHGNYGDYGQQKGDGKASITPQEQQKAVAGQILKWIKQN